MVQETRTWDEVEETVDRFLGMCCWKICPSHINAKTFRDSTKTLVFHYYESQVFGRQFNIPDAKLYTTCVRAALDTRKSMLGRSKKKHIPLDKLRYRTSHLREEHMVRKVDVDRILDQYAARSGGNEECVKCIRLCFWEGMKITEIAREYYKDGSKAKQQAIRRHIDNNYEHLSEDLRGGGFDPRTII